MSDGRLRNCFNGKQLLKLLEDRYGLNPLGIKQVFRINTSRFNEIKNGALIESREEVRLVNAFPELCGKILVRGER